MAAKAELTVAAIVVNIQGGAKKYAKVERPHFGMSERLSYGARRTAYGVRRSD